MKKDKKSGNKVKAYPDKLSKKGSLTIIFTGKDDEKFVHEHEQLEDKLAKMLTEQTPFKGHVHSSITGNLVSFGAQESQNTANMENFINECYHWIKCWGNGGGCLSMENHIVWEIEKIVDEHKKRNEELTEEKLWKELEERDPGYGCKDEYQGLIDAMKQDVKLNIDWELKSQQQG